MQLTNSVCCDWSAGFSLALISPARKHPPCSGHVLWWTGINTPSTFIVPLPGAREGGGVCKNTCFSIHKHNTYKHIWVNFWNCENVKDMLSLTSANAITLI